ncbi:uncharacterized protein LOC121719258 [Alosa sapidissima]|uniref:uncharacterized protein LOC121719258 n=1 Tax=Alosa sapidissima TaxID=34773 RepID=UPI001C0824F8|nr:uncharacterized protein LOC121719258 [Alosa sapidissima]XP_041960653.1 uncharacterized protein LOC121719258 [Alosa sapidissima]XP_041960655.1 uncharacterized protein LOC121719258 [Alosa sapidissima]
MENHGTSGEASTPETHPDVQPSEGGLLMAPTRKMPEELSPLTDYLTDLTEQEWVAFSQATADPVTKAQFLKLCVNLVQHVTMSSMNAVVPALIKLLTVDPQQFLTCSETHYCLLDLETAGPSLRWSDEGRHVTVLNNAMLMKASTEGSSGQTQEVTRTPDSRRSAEERSQQISFLDQFGITEEGIRQSVQATLKELNVVGCPSATEELTHSIVREAMVWVNTSLAEFKKAASSEPGSSALHEIFNAEEFVEKVSIKLDSRRSAEDARQSLLCWKRCSDACPSEEDLDPVLSSTVSDSMTVIIDTIESSLNEQDEDDCKNKPDKNLFSSIRQAVKAFACQSASLSEVSFYDEENQGDHIECISQVTLDSLFSSAVQPGKRPFSFDDFRLKANKAVRSVLVIKMKNFDSVPPSYTHVCATDTPASVDAPRSKTEHSPEPYWKPVEEAASLVIENFVEEIKAIAQSAECVDENEETAVETQPDDASSIEKMEPNAEKNPALLAAKKIFAKVQKTLEDFFIQLPTELHLHQAISAPSSDEVSDQNPQEPGEDPTQDFTQMASCRNEQLPQARTVSHLQLHQVQSEAAQSGHSALSQPDLDTCTRNVLKGVIASYHKQKEAAQPEETSLDPSTTPNDYVRNVISQLSNITSSSIEDSLSIVCIQNLSSSTFQRNAFDAVVDVLVTSVQSNGTLRPFVSSDNIEESAEPENDTCASSLPQEAEIENANAAASEIVDQFEKDLRKCIESLQSLRITNQSDMGSMEPLGTLRSTKEIPKQEFTSAASKVYHSVQVKVREIFAQLSFQRKWPYTRLEETSSKDYISDLSKGNAARSGSLDVTEVMPETTDLEDCTKEVMGELIMSVKEQIAEDQMSCTEGKTPTSGSYLAGNIMLEIENNFVYTSSPSMQSSANRQCSAELVLPITEIMQKLSSEDIQTKAVKQVSQVLLNSAKSSGTASSLPTESTASDLVGTVVEGIQTLFQSTSYNAMDNTISDSKGKSQGGSSVLLNKSQVGKEASKVKIWSVTREIFESLRRKVKDFITNSQLHESKVEEKVCAKQAISNVLVCIQEEVPNSGMWGTDSEHLHLFHNTINTMLQSLGDMDVQRPTSASSSVRKGKHSPLPQETLLGVVLTSSESPFPYMDGESLRDTMVDVVKVVLEKVDDGEASLSYAQGLTSVARSLERSLSSSSVNSFSHDLIDQIYGLFMRSNNSTPRQCVSDSALLKHEHEKASGMLTASEILQLYIEESVKHLFLPCFKLPSPWDGVKGGSQQQAQTSISCPSSLTDVASDTQGKMAATKSPPQILSDTVGLVVEMMVKEVMSGLTRALSPNSDLEAVEETSHSSNLRATKSFSSKLAEPQMSAGTSEGVQITPWPKAFPMDTDDYTGLVTILVVQLLTKINYGWFSYDMVSKAGELINKVVAAFSASSGISATEPYPEDIREHRIYRAVYSNLLTEFGSETDLLKAMESNRPSFQTSIVTSLTKELLQICDTQPVKGKGERGIFQKLNIGGKNVPSQSRKQWHSSNKDQSALSTTALMASANMSSSSETPLIEQSSRHSEKSRDARMPKKHCCFIKIFSALRGETS